MFYESYEQKILKVAKVKDFFHRFRLLFISIFTLIILLTSGYLSTKGMITKEITVSQELKYGENIDCNAEALFTDIEYYQFKQAGSDTWTTTPPTEIGEYEVRAVVKKSFGRNGYSDSASFEVLPQPLKITIDSSSVVYGSEPKYSVEGLVKGDKLEVVEFAFEDVKLVSTKVNLDTAKLKITNANGKDVTKAYAISCEAKDINITAADLEIKLNEKTKVYDGQAFIYDESFEFVNGQLYFGDELNITTKYGNENSEAINAGSYENEVISASLLNNGVDVVGQYSISYKPATITITKRPITIKTPTVSQVYNGQVLAVNSTEDCEVVEGSLVEGHELSFVSSSSIKHAGTITNEMVLAIVDKDGNDVTKNYDITYDYGTLEVLRKDIVVTLADIEKYYDTNGYLDVIDFELSEELFAGDSIVVTAEAKGAKDAGSYKIEAVDINLTSEIQSKIEDYNFICESSTLTIKRRPVTISPLSYNYTYLDFYNATSYTNEFVIVDGLEQDIQNNTLIDRSEVTINVHYEDLEGNVVDPSKEYLYVDDYKIIIDSHNNDLDKNYDITYETNLLTVNKRDVILTAANLPNKEYDSELFEYDPKMYQLYDESKGQYINPSDYDPTFEGEIYVKFLQDADYDIEAEPRNAGTYYIKVESYSDNFNNNYNIDTYKKIQFVIDPCKVEITYEYEYQDKIYDKELFDDYDLSFNLLSQNHTFTSVYLFNNDMVSLEGMYTVVENTTNSVEAIDSGRYTVLYSYVSVTSEEGTDVSSNYQFECSGLTLEIHKRNILLTPYSDEIDYYGNYYEYDNFSFIIENSDIEDEVEILELIEGLDAYINVKYKLLDESGNGLSEVMSVMNAGDYSICIYKHAESLDGNFNVSYGEGFLKINPCVVNIELFAIEKVYDGTNDVNPFNPTVKLTAVANDLLYQFEGLTLHNGEYISSPITFYLGDIDGNPTTDGINIGYYYLHIAKDDIVVSRDNYAIENTAEILNNYVFEYEPIEVQIIPREVTLEAYMNPSTVYYSGEVYSYDETKYRVVVDNHEAVSSYKLVDDSQLIISVEFYDASVGGNLIAPDQVKNADTYYVQIPEGGVEFVEGTGNPDNFIITFGDRIQFVIKPAEVKIELKAMKDIMFDGAACDDVFDFTIKRTIYGENGSVRVVEGLIGGDEISIINAMVFTDYNTLLASDATNVSKYYADVDTEKIEFFAPEDSDSVITNYKFSDTQQIKFNIIKRTIEMSGIKQPDYEYCGDPYTQYNPYDYLVFDTGSVQMDYELLLNILEDYDVTVTPYYVLDNGVGTYEPVNVGTYRIDVTASASNSLFEQNFDVTYINYGNTTLTITQKYICFKPIAQTFGYEDKAFEYPKEQYELLEDTYLCKPYHYANLEVYYVKEGVRLPEAPKDIYEFYEIHIESVKIYENDEDITANYDIDWYRGNDIYLNIFCAIVYIQLNQQESVYYGENYTFDPYDITVDGGLEGSLFKVAYHYTYLDGTELIEGEKYHPTQAGMYKIVVDDVIVEGKYPKSSYDIQPIKPGNDTFEIMRRKATITPVVNEELTYNFDNALPFTYKYQDITVINTEKNNGILEKDFNNISFDLLINGGAVTEFTSAGDYNIDIIENSLIGEENYDLTLVTNIVTVKRLDITVKLLNKEKVYDGKPLLFINEYEIYAGTKDITEKLDVQIHTNYNNEPDKIINAGTYTSKIIESEFMIFNYEKSNFKISCTNAIYVINKANVTISYNSPLQVFDYTGKDILIDLSFTVDPNTPLVDGEEISLVTYYKDGTNTSAKLPVHAGSYEAYYYDYIGPNKTKNYIVTANNDIKITVKKLGVVLSLLDKTHYFDGVIYQYPTTLNYVASDVYSYTGTVIDGEKFVFDVIYYDKDGNVVPPRYVATYEMAIDKKSVKTYVDGKVSPYSDYEITYGENKILTIEKNQVTTNTLVENGLSWYEYDPTNDYSVESDFNNLYYLSSDVRFEAIYSYYDSNNNLLPGKPVNAGFYSVKVTDCNVYINNKLDLQAKESITFDNSLVVDFEIGKRNVVLRVQSDTKDYDGITYEGEVPVYKERFIPGHEITYDIYCLDAPYNEIIDVRDGGYRITIDQTSIKFTDPTLEGNYNITVYDGLITINPRVLYLTPTLTFDEFYSGNDIVYTGDEWNYDGNNKDHQAVYHDSFKVKFNFYGVRETVLGPEVFNDSYANEAYEYTISIVDIEMIVGKRTNYDFEARWTSTGVIKPREIAVRTGTYETYYTGSDVYYAQVELLDGYTLAPGHKFSYLGYRPTIIYAVEGITSKENDVPFGVEDENGNDMSANYFVDEEKIIRGTIKTIERPITVITEGQTFTYNGSAQGWTKYQSNKDEILKDGITALIPTHEISVTGRTRVTNVSEGNVENKLTIKIFDKNGNDVTEYYKMDITYGTLKVDPFEVHVTLTDKNKYFDGVISNPTLGITGGALANSKHTANYVTSIVENIKVDDIITTESRDVLLYAGNYTVFVDGIYVTDEDGNDISSNYTIVPDNGDSYQFDIYKTTIDYWNWSKSAIWNGKDVSYGDYGWNSPQFYNINNINVNMVLDYCEVLKAYDEFGEVNSKGSVENKHLIKIYDIHYNKDITESCFDINYSYGRLSFTDTIRIDYFSSKYFDNKEFVIQEDENGMYIKRDLYSGNGIHIYGEDGAECTDVEVKIYITDILYEENPTNIIKDAGNYRFIIDESLTELIVNGENVIDKYNVSYGDFTYWIEKTVLIVWPNDKTYEYDGQEIKYEGFGIERLYVPYAWMPEEHGLYLKTTITEEAVLKKLNKSFKAYTTDVIICEKDEYGNYQLDEYGNPIPYEKSDLNYVVVYYDYDDKVVHNSSSIPHNWDNETGKDLGPMYKTSDFYGSFICKQREINITTAGYTTEYNGQRVKFDYDDITFNDSSDILSGHRFVLNLGYWEAKNITGNSTNKIKNEYWSVIDSDGNDVTYLYKLLHADDCGKVKYTKIYIEIGTKSESKYYDGTPLTYVDKEITSEDIFLINGFELINGDYISFEECEADEDSSVLFVGDKAENKIEIVIRNQQGEKVTKGYDIEEFWGELSIIKH